MKLVFLMIGCVSLIVWDNSVAKEYIKVQQQYQKLHHWTKMVENHKALADRLALLEKTSMVKERKITYLLQMIAGSYELKDIQVVCESHPKFVRCTLVAKAISDQHIFDFMENLPRLLPNVLGVTKGKIERHQSVTKEALAQLASGKALTFLTTTLTIDWHQIP